ncbi:MAG: 30S ribosomal protein S27e [Candidatus Aenigmarchaeota archaeon]|nr:30S ribosomal protein S27e [Candidatus Aenigmarchaeota archaeon]
MPKPYVKLPTSRFIKVECRKCKNIQTIFNKASTKVTCLKCGELLAEPTGGIVRVKGRIVSILS